MIQVAGELNKLVAARLLRKRMRGRVVCGHERYALFANIERVTGTLITGEKLVFATDDNFQTVMTVA